VEVEEIRPAYNKYKTKGELAASELRRWRESMAEGVELPDPTPLSLFRFALGFFKYEMVPEIVRYGWFLVWSRLCSQYYPYHKKLVLEGCKLDVYLQRKAYPQSQVHVDRKAALKRFHWHMKPWENILYRGTFVKDLVLKKLNLKGESHSGSDASMAGA